MTANHTHMGAWGTAQASRYTRAKHRSRAPRATTPSPKAKERALAAIKAVEHAMIGKMYLIGEKFSAADIVVGAIMRWADSLKLLEGAPDLASWLYELKSHASYKKAMA